MKFVLQFPKDRIPHFLSAYDYRDEDQVEEQVGPRVRAKGFYDKQDFVKIGMWKSARNQRHYKANEDEFIRTVTSAALSTTNEQFRIEAFRLLRGVDWPTASALLHFGSTESYPILDFRALESLGVVVPKNTWGFYNFQMWSEYTAFCRQLSSDCGVTIRELDKALWKFSESQDKG